MNHTQLTGFESFTRNGIKFLALVDNSKAAIYSQGDGRLHTWGAFYTVDSFLKRYAKGDLGPLD